MRCGKGTATSADTHDFIDHLKITETSKSSQLSFEFWGGSLLFPRIFVTDFLACHSLLTYKTGLPLTHLMTAESIELLQLPCCILNFCRSPRHLVTLTGSMKAAVRCPCVSLCRGRLCPPTHPPLGSNLACTYGLGFATRSCSSDSSELCVCVYLFTSRLSY